MRCSGRSGFCTIEKIPPILTIGACAALPEKAVELYHLDYGFLGIRIIKLFSKLDRDSASAEKELFYAPKGFADSFPGCSGCRTPS